MTNQAPNYEVMATPLFDGRDCSVVVFITPSLEDAGKRRAVRDRAKQLASVVFGRPVKARDEARASSAAIHFGQVHRSCQEILTDNDHTGAIARTGAAVVVQAMAQLGYTARPKERNL